jgi:ornithine carbamoyltransferase
MTPTEIQLGRGETISDTAKVLSRYLHGIVIRTHEHERLQEFAISSDVPVINGLSNLHHPCQVLADLMTIKEKKGDFKGLKIAYIGDGNNVANSLLEAAGRAGFILVIACPEGYEPDAEVLEEARTGRGEIIILREPAEAAAMADVLYTDVWISMGQEDETEKRRQRFKSYQLNETLLGYAKKDAIVMHCLPAHRGEEITDAVLDGPYSVVLDQAENRLHAQKALMEWLLGESYDK